MTEVWETWWSQVPARPGGEEVSTYSDRLKGVVWTEPRLPAPIAVRLAVGVPVIREARARRPL